MEHTLTKTETRFPHSELTRQYKLASILLLILHLVIVGVLLIFFRPGPEPIVLRYNVYFGIDIISAWWQIYLLPLLSAVFVSGNTFLGWRYLRQGIVLPAILFLLGSGVIVIGLVVAVAAIAFINY